jgi:hypothetical protein
VGALAFCLIADVGFLHYPGYGDKARKPKPLLPADRIDALSLEVLLRDDRASIREYWRRYNYGALGPLAAGLLPSIPKLAAGLEPYEIVKAVGRLPASPEVEARLRRVLEDEKADPDSRRAAKSALGRWEYRKADTGDDDPRADLGADDVGDIPSFMYGWAETPTEPEREAFAARVEDLARRLSDYAQPWNTFSDTPYRLRDVVKELSAPPFDGDEARLSFTDAEAKRILVLIEPHLRSR